MPIELKKARDFVYAHGVLWERALFAHRFESGSLEHVQRCLLAYKNPDGGYGHALEHDIRCPQSHALALEFLLRIIRDMALPVGTLLDGTVAWVEAHQNADGSLQNPPELRDYPHAPWWHEGGQRIPTSIVGNLASLGFTSDTLTDQTNLWVSQNLTSENLAKEIWFFLLYHPHDYFFSTIAYPEKETMREQTLKHLLRLARDLPENQYYSVLSFAPTPESPFAQYAPDFMKHILDVLENQQQSDGSWHDQHELPQWFSYTTILVLNGLHNHGRLSLNSDKKQNNP